MKIFRKSENVFKALMNEREAVPLLDDYYSICIGEANANNVITLVTNPYCSACSEAINTLADWMSAGFKVKLQIVFATEHLGKVVRELAYKILCVKYIYSDEKAFESLLQWHSNRKVKGNKWLEPEDEVNNSNADIALLEQEKWTRQIGIEYTPLLLFNGLRISEVYRFKELKYFLFNHF